mgnify:CR=1 FL=1
MSNLDKWNRKDASAENTISKIMNILDELNIPVEITESCNYKNLWYSNRMEIVGLPSIGTNGKGISEQYAMASCLGEFMERLQSSILLGYLFPQDSGDSLEVCRYDKKEFEKYFEHVCKYLTKDEQDELLSLKYKNILEIEVENALNVLKDFSSINHLDIKKNNINYYDLLMEAKETILPFFNDKNIKLNINSPRELFVNADYNRMKQVLINILKNSTEALSDNGKIDIKSYIENNKLITIIKDNGHGMDKETIDNLFTPFYSKKSFGTGLGLCLSKEIIELHNGTIKYTSKLNLYTEVKIVIPVY